MSSVQATSQAVKTASLFLSLSSKKRAVVFRPKNRRQFERVKQYIFFEGKSLANLESQQQFSGLIAKSEITKAISSISAPQEVAEAKSILKRCYRYFPDGYVGPHHLSELAYRSLGTGQFSSVIGDLSRRTVFREISKRPLRLMAMRVRATRCELYGEKAQLNKLWKHQTRGEVNDLESLALAVYGTTFTDPTRVPLLFREYSKTGKIEPISNPSHWTSLSLLLAQRGIQQAESSGLSLPVEFVSAIETSVSQSKLVKKGHGDETTKFLDLVKKEDEKVKESVVVEVKGEESE